MPFIVLQAPEAPRSLKAPALSLFSDFALALGAEFVAFVPVALKLLQQAGEYNTVR